MFGASPHSSDAVANHTTPMMNTRRRPNRSPSEPPSRISAASAKVYALIVHCSPEKPASSSVPMRSSATFTTLASSIASPDPSTVANSTHRPCAVPICTVAGCAAAVILTSLLSMSTRRRA
jgi:hypothetical protein